MPEAVLIPLGGRLLHRAFPDPDPDDAASQRPAPSRPHRSTGPSFFPVAGLFTVGISEECPVFRSRRRSPPRH
jgi:hypothetical protein